MSNTKIQCLCHKFINYSIQNPSSYVPHKIIIQIQQKQYQENTQNLHTSKLIIDYLKIRMYHTVSITKKRSYSITTIQYKTTQEKASIFQFPSDQKKKMKTEKLDLWLNSWNWDLKTAMRRKIRTRRGIKTRAEKSASASTIAATWSQAQHCLIGLHNLPIGKYFDTVKD